MEDLDGQGRRIVATGPRNEPAFRPGDRVVVRGIPASAAALPPEGRIVFEGAVGRTLRVDDVDADTGAVALNVRDDGSQADDWCRHTIWLEPELLAAVPGTAEDGGGAP